MSSPRIRREEDRVAGRVLGMFRSWLSRVRDTVMRPFRQAGAMPDPNGVFTGSDVWDEEVRGLGSDLELVARIGWSEVTGEVTFSSTRFAVMQALATSQNLMRNIPNEVHDLIVAEIMDGLSAGETAEQIAARVQRFLSVDENDHWRGRAQIIATTEVTRAANSGAFAAAMAVTESLPAGTVIMKRWNDSDDERVRITHQDVDEEERPLMQPFNVGGFFMLFPGDPTGPPQEVISCRCDLSFRRVDG